MSDLVSFVRESNLIEGIDRPPTQAEVDATDRFMGLFHPSADDLSVLQAVYAPNKPLRQSKGMDVRVGNYIAPPGGPEITPMLRRIIARAIGQNEHPFKTHCAFEMLHPYMDGNGRTGRALWAWQMRDHGRDPFALPFLHRFYYQTLEHAEKRETWLREFMNKEQAE